MIYTFFRLLRRWLFSDWQHIGIMVDEMPQYHSGDKPIQHYYHLFENQYGDRKHHLFRRKGQFQFLGQDFSKVQYPPMKVMLRRPVFQTKVYPWLHGSDAEGMPKYNKVPKAWFVRRLQGKDPVILNKEEKV
jgi:hypothetical protein